MFLTHFLNVNMTLTCDNNSANAFAGTFAFFASHRPALKKQKSLQANARGQCKLDTTDLRPKRSPAGNKGLKEMAGEVVNQTFVLLINSSGRLTVCASKPPLL